MKNIGLLLLMGLLASCSQSLVYSPSLNLTNQPIKEKEIDLQGGIELLPETRPEELGGSQTTFGVGGQVSYGFSDKFNMTVKGWADAEGRENSVRTGFSLSGQFLKPLDETSTLIILPRAGMAINGINIAGFGLATSIIYQRSLNESLSWYGGAGLLWGFRHFDKELNYNNEEKLPMGFSILGNLGLAWQISNRFRLNFEVNLLYQINSFDENTQLMASPSIGLGYTIPTN